MGIFPNGISYVDNYRAFMKDQKESERISPKEYGMMIQRKRKKKKRGGK